MNMWYCNIDRSEYISYGQYWRNMLISMKITRAAKLLQSKRGCAPAM